MKKYSMDEINKIRERMTSGDMYQTTDWPEIPRAFDQLLTENATLKKQLEVAVAGLINIKELSYGVVVLEGSKAIAGKALAEIKRIGGGE